MTYRHEPARYGVGHVSPAMWVTRLVVWAIQTCDSRCTYELDNMD